MHLRLCLFSGLIVASVRMCVCMHACWIIFRGLDKILLALDGWMPLLKTMSQSSFSPQNLVGQLTDVYWKLPKYIRALSAVQNPPAMQELRETWVLSLGQKDPPGGGHGNPLQCPCLGNPMDRGAWWATLHRVAKCWIQLKRPEHAWTRYIVTLLDSSDTAVIKTVMIFACPHGTWHNFQNLAAAWLMWLKWVCSWSLNPVGNFLL